MLTPDDLPPPILVVDEDEAQLALAQAALGSLGLGPVAILRRLDQVPDFLQRHRCALVMVTLSSPAQDGAACLRRIIVDHPGISVVATGANDAAQAIQCLRTGAADYLVRPFAPALLIETAKRILSQARLRSDDPKSPRRYSEDPTGHGAGGRMLEQALTLLGGACKPLLIVGEPGTGKRRLARSIHQLAALPGPFAAVYATAMDEVRLRLCLTQLVGGSLFINEISLLSPATQELLAQHLMDQDSRLPDDQRPRVQVILANSPFRTLLGCNQRLLALTRRRHLVLPPLRACRADIPDLVTHLVSQAALDLGQPPPVVPATLFRLIKPYGFPGNIRELRALVRTAVRLTTGRTLSLTPFHEALAMVETPRPAQEAKSLLGQLESLPSLRDIQGMLIEEALRRTHNHQSSAAVMLGISRQALHKRLRGRQAGDQD